MEKQPAEAAACRSTMSKGYPEQDSRERVHEGKSYHQALEYQSVAGSNLLPG